MSKQLLKIGLTGGIASGKSQVVLLFKKRNINIIDSDKIARDLFANNSIHLSKLEEKFGNRIFLSDGSLDRKALRKIVFNCKEDLAWLNEFTHPLIAEESKRQLLAVTSPYVVLDIPLLINTKGEIPAHLKRMVNRVLLVDVELDTQLLRLCQRDKLDLDSAKAIIANQSTREQKLALADDIIDNNQSLDRLEPQVEKLHNYYLNQLNVN